MSSIVVMFDTLNRLCLPSYGARGVRSPGPIAGQEVAIERIEHHDDGFHSRFLLAGPTLARGNCVITVRWACGTAAGLLCDGLRDHCGATGYATERIRKTDTAPTSMISAATTYSAPYPALPRTSQPINGASGRCWTELTPPRSRARVSGFGRTSVNRA